MKICSMCNEPDRPVHSRGLCNRCYLRRWKAGSIEVNEYRRPTEEYFFEKVDASGPCWEWVAGKDRQGYGQFSVTGGKKHQAHRWCWEFLTGESLEGFELNHMCRNTGCVNPDHLERLTPEEHQARTLLGLYGIVKTAGATLRRGVDF